MVVVGKTSLDDYKMQEEDDYKMVFQLLVFILIIWYFSNFNSAQGGFEMVSLMAYRGDMVAFDALGTSQIQENMD